MNGRRTWNRVSDKRNVMDENKVLWRIWVDTRQRIVSFHEAEGCEMLEFHSQELFRRCIDQYTAAQYRYQ